MTKLVYETAAARQLDAHIVLKGKRIIARVLAHHTESACTVNVIHMDGDAEQGNHALLWAESAAHDLARGAIKPETIKTVLCVGWRLTLMVTDNSDAMVAYLDKGSRHG